MKSDNFITDTDALLCLKLLSRHPVFSTFSTPDLMELISECAVQTYRENEIVVKEGELVDAVYFILKGHCEVRKQAVNASDEFVWQPIATLIEGESIGLSNTGLFSTTGIRTATIVSLSDVKLICLNIKIFRQFLANHPNADKVFSDQIELLKRMLFIKSVAPFSSVSNQHIRQIAEQIEEKTFPPGVTIFTQGDQGDACYIITEGKVEISTEANDGNFNVLITLDTNGIFGESALLLDTVRNATARTAETTTLLKIDKPLFIEITQQQEIEQEALMQLQLKRCRPIKMKNIDVYTQRHDDGVELTVLRNTAQGKYIQLSEHGLFMWNLLDGEMSINEIAIQYFLQFNAFNVEEIERHIINLHKAGFVQLDVNEKMIPVKSVEIPRWVHIFSRIREIMEYKIAFGNVDKWMSKAFNSVGWIFFTKPALILWPLITLLGFASFVFHFEGAIQSLTSSSVKWPLFFLSTFLVLLTIPLHELAHAFTTKHFGRKVDCVGIGWLWLSPFAFCDTSDMWLSPWKQRFFVDVAGMYLNAILAGLAGLGVFLVFPDYPNVVIVLELFALNSYLFIIANLDTAFEFDGYYALMDVLNRPNLRISSIKWLIGFSNETKNAPWSKKWENIKTHFKEVLYWLCTLSYLLVISSIVSYVVFGHLLVGLFGVHNPMITIGMTLLAILFSSIGIYKDVLTRMPAKAVG